MSLRYMSTTALCGAIALAGTHQTAAEVTAEAQLVLTIELTNVFIQDGFNGADALGDTAELFDINYEKTNFFNDGGGSPLNPPGSIGSDSNSRTVFFNGVDFDDGDFFAGENVNISGPNTVVVTQNLQSTSTTSDTRWFSQIDSEVSFSFDNFFNDEFSENFSYEFTVSAVLTGSFDLDMPGSGLVGAEFTKVSAFSQDTLFDDSGEFELIEDYYTLGTSTTSPGNTPFSLSSTPVLIPVDFSTGESGNTITFHTSVFVNSVTAVPEPSTGLLLAGLGLCAAARRRRY